MERLRDTRVLVGLGLLVAVLIGNAAVAYVKSRRVLVDAVWEARTQRVLDLTGEVQRTLAEAEAGQRGFLVTGDEAFLPPYHEAFDRLDRQFRALQDETHDDPRRLGSVRELETLAADRLRLLKRGVDLRRTNPEEARALTAAGEGREKAAAARRLVTAMQESEYARLGERQRASAGVFLGVAWTELLAVAVGLVGVGVLVAGIRRGAPPPVAPAPEPPMSSPNNTNPKVSARLLLDEQVARRAAEEAERQVRASEERLRLFVENTPAAVAMLDRNMHYLLVSRRRLRDYGLEGQDVIGRDYYEVFPNVPERWKEIHRRCLAGATERCEEDRFIRPDGQEVWLRWEICPWRDPHGEIGGVLIFSEVITDRKRAEEALREADRRKDEFLATLAHELRNPLAPIRNALHILKPPATDAAAAERLRAMMERQVRHMTRMVDDLLDVSRITRGKVVLRKEVVTLAGVVERVVEATRPLVEERRHEVTLDLPPEPVCLEADPTRLEQVLANLLNNAAKYTDPGGRVRLTARREGGDLVLHVRDNGVGIAADMLGRVFEPFVQADRVLHQSQGGLGIGLTLVRRLVEMHGGTVTAHSDGPGTGSEFVVRLPALGKDEGGRLTEEPEAAPVDPSRRVLVVDDNVDAAESLAMLLRMAGHEVRVAHDGPAALAAVEADPPEVVFLDIGMPVMNGYDVARRLRERPGLMLVAMTGWGQDEDLRRSREAGFAHHLVKPVEPATLYRLLAVPG